MALIEVLFNNMWTISRRVRTDDGQGGWSISYTDIGTVEGRMRPALTSERVTADQEERRITHVFYVLEGTDIARGDLAEADDLIVEVMGVREPSRMDHHLEIDCEERQAEETEAGSGS